MQIHSVLAATLKNRRLKLQLTLKDITDGVCSISYASKIENNSIVADSNIMRLLFEKVNIDYDDLLSVEQTNELPKCLKCYLFLQFDAIAEMYHNLDDKYFFARNSLLKIIYYLSIRNFDDAVVELKTLEEVKNTLSNFELFLLILLTVEYNILNKKYRSAQRFSDLLYDYDLENQDLEMLYSQQRFLIAVNLRDYQHIYDYYLHLKSIGYPLKNQFYINILFLESFAENEAVLEAFDNMELDYIPEEYYQDFYYSKSIILLRLHKYIDVIKLITEKNYTDVRFVALLGYAVLMIKNKDRNVDEMDQYIENFMDYYQKMEYDNYDSLHLGFVRLMKMEIENESKESIFDYLKNYLLIEEETFQHRLYSFYYAFRYLQMLGERSRYKDAYLFTINNPKLVSFIKEFE
ncbi:MAG TPA: hypothetical protein GXZ48_07755 [Acholeplasmataceae bacterium]|nr:hypothetical protein [Acholeplasmataceae bacterium]